RLKKRINKKEYSRIINSLWVWLEKTLRKVRINFLKIDNKIINVLDKLREKKTEVEVDKKTQIDNIEKHEDDIFADQDQESTLEQKEIFELKAIDQKETEVESYEHKDEDKGVDDVVMLSEEKLIDEQEDKEDKEDKKDEEVKEIDSHEDKDENLYVAKEDAKGKEKEYIEAIIKNPIDIKSYWKLGIVYSRRKNYKDAISCFRQITKIDPTYKKAKNKISDLLERMKDKKEDKKKKKEEKKEKKDKKEDVEIVEKEEKQDIDS
ncbi:MAG: tetratricopeptide repeat protein, partial [Candidatus Pacebacteria bacterium]|nr:tetratricopeptide repeat protein [Candidatus Paceibacterota bacterium]